MEFTWIEGNTVLNFEDTQTHFQNVVAIKCVTDEDNGTH